MFYVFFLFIDDVIYYLKIGYYIICNKIFYLLGGVGDYFVWWFDYFLELKCCLFFELLIDGV